MTRDLDTAKDYFGAGAFNAPAQRGSLSRGCGGDTQGRDHG